MELLSVLTQLDPCISKNIKPCIINCIKRQKILNNIFKFPLYFFIFDLILHIRQIALCKPLPKP